MRKALFFLAAILLAHISIFSQVVLTNAFPEAGGFSSERLKRLDNKIQEWVDQKWINGGVAMIVHDGKVVYKKAFGLDNTDKKTSLRTDHLFRLASQTKAVTSVGVMVLYEEGKLLLDDAVSKYIPEFKNVKVLDKFNAADTTYTTVNVKRSITIRDLLTHTSGIGYAQIGSASANAIYAKDSISAGLAVREGLKVSDVMKRLGRLPLMHQPGERFTYGLNTDLLGYLIEVISGISLDQFFKTRIFQPLGMTDTYFYLPADKQNRLAVLSLEDSTGINKMPEGYVFNGARWNALYPNTKGTYHSGGAGLTSTITDYAVFLQMLLNGGTYNNRKILSRNSVRMMTSNQIGDLNLGIDKFGLGFSIATEKTAARLPVSVGTFGWGGAFSTSYWVDPKEKIIAQFYTQVWGRTHNTEDAFKVLVYQALNN